MFREFFLKNSSYSSLPLQTSAWPLTQPNSPTRPGTLWVRVHHSPTPPSQCPQSQWVHKTPVCWPLRPYSAQQRQASRSILVLLKPPYLAWEGATDLALSQESCGRPGGQRSWGCSHPGSGTGPRDLIVPKHSPYHLIFQYPLQFWPPTIIYAGIPMAVHSVPQKTS